MSKTWEEFAKSIPGNKMTNFKTFGTTGSTGIFSQKRNTGQNVCGLKS